ncbi:MAG: reverse transcriptase domain-containing protein [Sedimenticola sp.]
MSQAEIFRCLIICTSFIAVVRVDSMCVSKFHGNSSHNDDFVAGNLSKNIDNWCNLTNNPVVIEWVKHGVAIPFDKQPEQFFLPNRYLNERHIKFVDSEIRSLTLQGAIEKVEIKPFCVSPIGVVPKKGNKLRLVCDLRQINDYCTPPKFVYENIDTVLNLVEYNDKFVSTDLKNGFHHVFVREEDRKYLGIYWRGDYYQWRVLPFGWSCSPYFFCKILRPLTEYLRVLGLKIVIYVDDILLISPSSDIEHHKDILLHTLNKLGWFIKYEKCSLDPSTRINYIGYSIDSVGENCAPVLKINSERVRKLRNDLRRLLKKKTCSKRHLARIAGQCVSMSKAVLPAKLLLRNTYRLLSKCPLWDMTLTLDVPTLQDLEWWISALESWNGFIVKPSKDSIQMECDASATGWGSCIGNQETFGLWDRSMAIMPSNFRELAAVYLGLKSFSSQLKGNAVTVLSDNIVTCAYLNHLGGPTPSLTNLAKAVWAIVFDLDITLRAHYYPGHLNRQADALSRQKSTHEWKLHPGVFRYIDKAFGPHTVDRFASFQTRQLPRYNSLSYDPETEAIDALSQDWRNEVNFVNAPFRLIPKVIDLVQNQSASATLIAPHWPNQTWYRKLQAMSVRPPIRIPNSRHAVQHFGQKPEPLKNRRWKIYAWKISGNRNCVVRDGRRQPQIGYQCAGQNLHWPLTTDSYRTLQNFVRSDTAVFRPMTHP